MRDPGSIFSLGLPAIVVIFWSFFESCGYFSSESECEYQFRDIFIIASRNFVGKTKIYLCPVQKSMIFTSVKIWQGEKNFHLFPSFILLVCVCVCVCVCMCVCIYILPNSLDTWRTVWLYIKYFINKVINL